MFQIHNLREEKRKVTKIDFVLKRKEHQWLLQSMKTIPVSSTCASGSR